MSRSLELQRLRITTKSFYQVNPFKISDNLLLIRLFSLGAWFRSKKIHFWANTSPSGSATPASFLQAWCRRCLQFV